MPPKHVLEASSGLDRSNLSFSELGVPANLVGVLSDLAITTPTPIQSATLRDSIAGRDVLGRGRTGSGKTYAFLLPLVTRLVADPRPRRPKAPRALILAPTRELVGQISAALEPLARINGLTTQTVFGGVGASPQVQGLRRGVDIVLACPGRLEDLIRQGAVTLREVQITVLDEADHMADLGFLPAVKRLLQQTAPGGQRLLFSATLDSGVGVLVRQFLRDPRTHEADWVQSPIASMDHHVLHVRRDQRLAVLTDLTSAPGRTVVFTRTKHGAKALARQLTASGVPTVELHGNLSQGARVRTMEAFHSGATQTLVATDIAARGIHVDDIKLVVHADPPAEHKAYLHRSGRTARAGNRGTVVTLMTDEQVGDVRSLTRAAGIHPATTKITSLEDPVLHKIAPGERVLVQAAPMPAPTNGGSSRGNGGPGRPTERQRSSGIGPAKQRRRSDPSIQQDRTSAGQSRRRTGQGRRRGAPSTAASSGSPSLGSSDSPAGSRPHSVVRFSTSTRHR